VFVVAGGRAHLVRVALGPSDGDFVVITSGLREGEEVIAQPSDALEDGTRVEPGGPV
jgi:membrane fusion protein, multidrug efflux system